MTDSVSSQSNVPAPTIVVDKGVNVVLLRGRSRPWWEGIDGKIRRGDPIEGIPAGALKAFGEDHWDGRADVTVAVPALKIVTTVTEER